MNNVATNQTLVAVLPVLSATDYGQVGKILHLFKPSFSVAFSIYSTSGKSTKGSIGQQGCIMVPIAKSRSQYFFTTAKPLVRE